MTQATNKAFAEVIESSLIGFTAQCWQWDAFPSFGSLVTVTTKKRVLCGIVHQINTGSMDPTRYPFPYKKTEDELLREQPQIFEFLKTTFACLAVGYQEAGPLMHIVPPEPAKIHAFVAPMSVELCREFFYQERYLHLLFSFQSSLFNLDELLLALLQQQSKLQILTPEKLTNFTQHLSLLTGNDYRRLKLFLQRAQPLVETHI